MSRPSLSGVLVLALLAVLCLLVVPLPGGADTHGDGETRLVAELNESGDADWQITVQMPLADEEEVAAFAAVADEFEAGEYEVASHEMVQMAAEAVNDSTDRPMTVTDQTRTSAIEGNRGNRTGSLTVSFTWENFARMGSEGDNLYIDDVLETERGLWLQGLTSDMKLVVVAPDGYAVLDASVPPQNGELHWEGPAEFDREMLSATFVGNGNGTDDGNDDPNSGTDDDPGDGTGDDPDGGTDGTDDGSDDGDTGDSGIGLLGFVVGGVAVALVAALLVVYRERLEGMVGDSPTPEPGGSATDGGTQTETESPGTATAGVDPETATDNAESSTDTDSDDSIDEELLSDEERVERLLERNGGRMKQADIVDETGWSNAKVSQLLSSMADDDRVDKLRIGRENLISFPDVDVTDTDSS